MKKTNNEKAVRQHRCIIHYFKIEPLDLVNPGDDLVRTSNRRTLCTSTSILVMPDFKSI